MADKLRVAADLERLQNKYLGIGHADISKHEWLSSIARDSQSSYVGHPPMLLYMSIGLGECVEQVRMRCLENMVLPTGPRPRVEE